METRKEEEPIDEIKNPMLLASKGSKENGLRQAMAERMKELLEKQRNGSARWDTEETGEAKKGDYPRKELRTMFGPIRD